jgi:integrase
LRVQSQQLPTESQVFEDEVFTGTAGADHPAKEMSERRDHSQKLIGKIRIELCAKSFILQAHDILARHNQWQPVHSSETMKAIAVGSEGRERMLYVLLGATGLRFGEAFGLEIDKHISDDFSTLHIRQKVWSGHVQLFLKTGNGVRDIDLHPSISAMLKKFIGDRTSGFVFHSKNGFPLLQSNVLRLSLHPLLKRVGQPISGAHAFRRFRATWLRKQHAPEDLIRFWLGHANQSVTDMYSKLKDDVTFRKKVAEEVGIGFELPAEKPEVAPCCTHTQLLSHVA